MVVKLFAIRYCIANSQPTKQHRNMIWKNKKKRTFLLLFFCVAASAIYADHPSLALGNGMSGSITALSAIPIERGAVTIGMRAESQNMDEIPDAALRELGEAHEHVHSVEALWTVSLTGSYGLSDNVMVGASLPCVQRSNIREPEHVHGAPDEVSALGDSEGLGDLRLYGLYGLSHTRASSAYTALIGGIKAPTGNDDEAVDLGHEDDHGHSLGDEDAHAGARFEAEHQPGSGSWDPFLGLAHSQSWSNLSLHASLLYTLATEGTQDTDLGDSVHYNLAAAFPLGAESHKHKHGGHAHVHSLNISWEAIIELNGEWREQQKIAGETKGNSGGNLILLAPGIRAVVADRWVATLSIGVPIATDLHGTQSEPELRTIASVGVGF